MVESGLSVRTDVSHLRLATHLLVALVHAGRHRLDRARPARAVAPSRRASRPLQAPGRGDPGAILFVQLLFGALVAGLNAGLVTNEWPLMNGHFFPGASQAGESVGDALFNDPAIVHFVHRWWAWVAVAA
jgi:cytochrome c oxidase assembly protein subunit 15